MTNMKMTAQKVLTATAGLALAMSLVACGATTDGEVSGDVEVTDSTVATDNTTDKQDSKDTKDASDDTSKPAAGKDDIEAGLLTEPLDNGYSSGKHVATIKVKDYGTIQVELDADAAPITVSNFADLANRGFYDGLTFHRIMRNFMIQGGDPNGDGTGGSPREIKGEFSENGVDTGLKHERGTISMARSASMDSASSQFFICDADDDFLDGNYAAFGHVIKGMGVVDAIAKDAKPIDDNGTIPAKKQPIIESVRVGDGSLG